MSGYRAMWHTDINLDNITDIFALFAAPFSFARFLFAKRGPLFSFVSLNSLKDRVFLPLVSSRTFISFVICKILPAFRTRFERNLQRLSKRGTKHGVEGRRRSCVTVPFSLPPLGVLGRMCCEDFEWICVVKISKYVAKILKCDVKILE